MEKVGLLGASKEKEEDSIRKLSSQMTDRKKEPIVKVQVRPRRGGKFIMEKWLADSGVKRTLMLEASSLEMNKENTGLVLNRTRVKFKPYGTQVILPVKGRCKVVLKNENGGSKNSMVYVVAGQPESLLGKMDAEALVILQINVKGGTAEVNRVTQVLKEETQRKE